MRRYFIPFHGQLLNYCETTRDARMTQTPIKGGKICAKFKHRCGFRLYESFFSHVKNIVVDSDWLELMICLWKCALFSMNIINLLYSFSIDRHHCSEEIGLWMRNQPPKLDCRELLRCLSVVLVRMEGKTETMRMNNTWPPLFLWKLKPSPLCIQVVIT